jgi:acyl-CoA oxidase
MHTPTEKAMKFWIGGLAQVAERAVVFAQLWTKGKCHGMHVFHVYVRDRKNHMPFKGVTIGDCGHKNGCDGVDNGWMMFDNYRISKDALLD